MERISTVSFSLLREMKKSNDGQLILLDLFELEQKRSVSQLIFMTETVFFVRNIEELEVYANTYLTEMAADDQYILFTSRLSAGLYQTILDLLDGYQIEYLELTNEQALQNLPFQIEKGLIGQFGYQKTT